MYVEGPGKRRFCKASPSVWTVHCPASIRTSRCTWRKKKEVPELLGLGPSEIGTLCSDTSALPCPAVQEVEPLCSSSSSLPSKFLPFPHCLAEPPYLWPRHRFSKPSWQLLRLLASLFQPSSFPNVVGFFLSDFLTTGKNRQPEAMEMTQYEKCLQQWREDLSSNPRHPYKKLCT